MLWIWIKIGSVFSIFMDLYLYTEYGSGSTGKQLKIAPHKLKAKGLKFKKIVFLKKKIEIFFSSKLMTIPDPDPKWANI